MVDDPDGEIWGVPYKPPSIFGVLYNKKVLSDLNLDIPKGFDELLEDMQVIKDAGISPTIPAIVSARGKASSAGNRQQ